MMILGVAWNDLLEWFRIAGGVIGMIAVAVSGFFGLWIYMRKTKTAHEVDAQQRVIEIYEKQLSVQKEDLTRLEKESTKREAQVVALQAKTDITIITNELARLHEHGQLQYKEAMLLLNTMLKTLLESTAAGLQQAKDNFSLLTRAVTSMESLARRFGSVEKKVDDLQQAVVENGHIVIKEEEEPPERPERRKSSR